MAAGNRRQFLGVASATLLMAARSASATDPHAAFVAEAQRMKQQAIDAGDQPYGAVVVRDGVVIGYGPSRVVTERNSDAHAERVALREARAGGGSLAGAVLYATSRPCPACERAAAEAGIARMYVGPRPDDAGAPGRP